LPDSQHDVIDDFFYLLRLPERFGEVACQTPRIPVIQPLERLAVTPGNAAHEDNVFSVAA
jgi:hypothetical protein